jgi:hypothetical protein
VNVLWIALAFGLGAMVGALTVANMAGNVMRHTADHLIHLLQNIQEIMKHTGDGRLDPTFIEDTLRALVHEIAPREKFNE